MKNLEQVEKEIEILIRSRYPIIYLVTWEEDRTEKILERIAKKLGKKCHSWTSSGGFPSIQLEKPDQPLFALDHILKTPESGLFVLKDFHVFLNPERNFELNHVIRKLRDLASQLRTSKKTLIIQAPLLQIPLEIEKDITVIDIPLPNQEEIREILDGILSGLKDHKKVQISQDPTLKERVTKAALGLTAYEAENVFCKSIVHNLKFDEEDLELVLYEKKQIIRKSQILEYLDLKENLNNVGGLNGLKNWLNNRTLSFSEKARAYGLPQPKGLLLLGVQGCGKSLAAKAVAHSWTLPLLRMDIGNLFSSYIGSSEANMRKALKTAESLAPCVLWIDEIEKGFAGVQGAGTSDSGTSKRIFASFLTWLQEKTAAVFVIATANSIKNLPPELLRKGRFDEIFFIDLPKKEDRIVIFDIHIRKRNRDPKKFDLPKLALASDGFNGAEIEQAIISALYDTFPKDRDIETQDILEALRETVPLSVTMAENVQEIREWASKRARMAS